MQTRRLWRYLRPSVLAVLIALTGASTVLAETSSSNNYELTESQFGASSNDETCSGQYCARVSIGDGTSGETASTGSTASFGGVTPDQPSLDVIVDPGESNLGTLTAEHTATKTMTVRVRSYLSNGYVMQITGDPPTYDGHALAAPSTPTASTPGTEQFALNAVANTSPSVGANPVQVPDSQFSFGQVNTDYSTPNRFKYTSGDDIAQSTKASGRTDYTISMIVNISNKTPAGHYSGDFSAVVIPVY